MMNNLLCKTFVMGALICSTQLSAQKVSDKQPWSVRMVESEMIRCPESWQLDFQPKLKWDYCHGLELQAMLDVYDTYGDKKMFDYALAYADTMIHNDGSIETYKLHEYNIDRLNSGKFLFRIYEQTKDEKYKKAIDLLRSSSIPIHAMRMEVSGIRRFIPIRCGWMASIWGLHSMQNMLTVTTAYRIIRILSISLLR